MVTLDHKNSFDTKAVSNRVFGLLTGSIFSILSLLPLLWGNPHKQRLLALGLCLVSLGLILPSLLTWPKKIWFFITHKISIVVNFVLLSAIFYLVVTPVALFMRMAGRDALHRKWNAKAESYWVKRDPQSPRSSMTNQF